MRFFTNNGTRFFKTSNCSSQGLQNAAFQQLTLHVSSNNPISEEKWKTTSTKIQILWFGYKEIEHIHFWKSNMRNQLKLILPKEWGFWSWKGLNIWTLLYLLCNFNALCKPHLWAVFCSKAIFGIRTYSIKVYTFSLSS